MSVRISDDFRAALNVGTTLTTRVWLGLAMMLYGFGFFLNQENWLLSPSFKALNNVIPLQYWGVAYILAGLLGLWRTMSAKSHPLCGWFVNTYIFVVWFVSCIVRFWGIGPFSLLSLHTAFLFMAAWCLVRTEATVRDTETA